MQGNSWNSDSTNAASERSSQTQLQANSEETTLSSCEPPHQNEFNNPSQLRKQQTQQRGVETSVNLRRRFASCKLATAKSICRHRSCKALSSSSLPPPPATSSKKSSKALANLHNVTTTNFVLGVGSHARSAGVGREAEATDDVKNNYEKFMLSLQSPLPNEHSLTLNTLMILSSVVREEELNILEKTPALLNMLLAHVGFYNDCALRSLMEQTCDHRDFNAFWQDAKSETEDVYQLQQQLLCECFPQDGIDYDGKCCDGCRAPQVQVSLNKPPNAALPVATEKVGGEVQQIGHILRNLSFDAGNASQMAMSATMVRFLLVAGTSEHGTLPQISFDIISNIAKYIVLVHLASNDKGALFQLQAIMTDLVMSAFINSGDRFKILRCFEALQGLVLSLGDREAKLRIFRDMRLFEKLFQFLTLKEDTILVINCLECMLAATAEGMGKIIYDKIIESLHGCLATLVSYLTVDVMEKFVKKEDGFRNENFKTELVGIKGALGNKPVKKISFSEAVSEEKKINRCAGNQSYPCAKNKCSRIIPTSTHKQTSIDNFQENSHISPSSSPQRKLGPFDEAATIMENVKKIPEGKAITVMLSAEALSLLELNPELKMKRLNFSTDNLPSPSNIDSCKKVYVELVHNQGNNFVRNAPTGMICCPSLSSSLRFSLAPSLNNILETAIPIPFLCEWDYCGSRHVTKIQLRWHVYLWHIPNNKVDKSVCKWRSRASSVEGCSYPRDKDCLLEHLKEHHYNDIALEQALDQRIIKNIISPVTQLEKSTISNGQGDYEASGGPKTRAQGSGSWQQPQIEEKEEHVVNKSVRLTAALILRNFAKNSCQARRSLRQYEMQLAEVAMTGYDCSGIISHVLHYISEGDGGSGNGGSGQMQMHVQKDIFVKPQTLLKHHSAVAKSALHRLDQQQLLTQIQKMDLEMGMRSLFIKYRMENDMKLNYGTKGEDPAIGIDFGTTYCCVGVYLNGQVIIVPNQKQDCKRRTPSFVAYEQNGSLTVGEPAKNNAFMNPENTIFDHKRMIGRPMNDEKLQSDIRCWPVTVVSEEGLPKIKLSDGRLLYPEEISTELLKECRKIAEDYLKMPRNRIKKAVITVPAYFEDGQRQATVNAGRLAGLEVLTILNEPTAAAMAIAYSQKRKDAGARKVLTFDMGRRTFDVAVLDVKAGEIEVLGVSGDTHLGGEDFHCNMMKYCAQKFKDEHGIDLLAWQDSNRIAEKNAKFVQRRLKQECENAKKHLSTARPVKVSVDEITRNLDLNVDVSREVFKEINAKLFSKSIEIVEAVLKKVGVLKESIDDIVLVGGSTRIPRIQELLKQYFGGKAINRTIDPDNILTNFNQFHINI